MKSTPNLVIVNNLWRLGNETIKLWKQLLFIYLKGCVNHSQPCLSKTYTNIANIFWFNYFYYIAKNNDSILDSKAWPMALELSTFFSIFLISLVQAQYVLSGNCQVLS